MSEEPGSHEASFEERLAAARGNQGLEAARSGPGKSPDGLDASALAIGVRVGVEMVSALVVAVAIGWGLDWLFGTRPILTAVFVLLGGAAGVLNVWRMFAPKSTPAGGKRGAGTDVGGKAAGELGVGDKALGDKAMGSKDRGL
jgi:ATP synthase protein I